MDIHTLFPETFVVAEVNGTTVGYIMCRIERGLSNLTTFKFIKKGHVISIAVLSEYRRLGVGYALLLNAMRGALNYGASEIFLEVRISNVPAVNLYRLMGFEVVQQLSRYYTDGETAYRMARRLPFKE